MPTTVYKTSEGQRFNTDTTLTVVTCATCKIVYAIPDSLYRSAVKWPGDRDQGWKICCPMGHTWWYTGSNPDDKLQRERDHSAYLRSRLDQTEASLIGQKARGTRFKNERDRERRRVAHGVCPVCKRTLKQLTRHMESQHPDFIDHADAAPHPE